MFGRLAASLAAPAPDVGSHDDRSAQAHARRETRLIIRLVAVCVVLLFVLAVPATLFRYGEDGDEDLYLAIDDGDHAWGNETHGNETHGWMVERESTEMVEVEPEVQLPPRVDTEEDEPLVGTAKSRPRVNRDWVGRSVDQAREAAFGVQVQRARELGVGAERGGGPQEVYQGEGGGREGEGEGEAGRAQQAVAGGAPGEVGVVFVVVQAGLVVNSY